MKTFKTKPISLSKWLALSSLLLMITSCQHLPARTEFGIQLWSVRTDMQNDPASTLAALGEMGYDFVEAAGYSNGKFYGMTPEVFRNLVEDNGMIFLSSHVGRNLPGEEDWDEAMQWWAECIDAHAAAGVKYIVQPSMSRAGYNSLEGLARYCAYFNTIGEMCNERGIRFGYHNHASEFQQLEGEIIFDYMLQHTDPSRVMFQMDLYWVVVGGADPVDYFERYPGRFEHWHVKDEAEVGQSGNIDFARIFQHTELSGARRFIVEVEQYKHEPLESVRMSLDFLRESGF